MTVLRWSLAGAVLYLAMRAGYVAIVRAGRAELLAAEARGYLAGRADAIGRRPG